MTNEEIRKLLGGYATNTLTETERKVLFDAALEDQDLFNALQDDQALKELLQDPVSRAQVQQALREPVSGWWTRWWAWGGAVSAVAAAVLIVAVIRSNQTPQTVALNEVKAPPPQSAPAPVAVEKQKAIAPKPRRDADRESAAPATRASRSFADSSKKPSKDSAPGASNDRKDEVASTTSPSARSVVEVTPSPPPPASPQPTVQQVQLNGIPGGPSQNSQNAIQNQSQDSFKAGTGALGGFATKEPPALRYSLVKRDANGAYLQLPSGAELETGDAIRLSVLSSQSGYLSLEQLEASGSWKRIFPEPGPGMPLIENISRSIPESAITVADKDQQFRLVLAPFGALAESVTPPGEPVRGRRAARRNRGMMSEPAAQMSAARAQVIVNLTIGPKKAP